MVFEPPAFMLPTSSRDDEGHRSQPSSLYYVKDVHPPKLLPDISWPVTGSPPISGCRSRRGYPQVLAINFYHQCTLFSLPERWNVSCAMPLYFNHNPLWFYRIGSREKRKAQPISSLLPAHYITFAVGHGTSACFLIVLLHDEPRLAIVIKLSRLKNLYLFIQGQTCRASNIWWLPESIQCF